MLPEEFNMFDFCVQLYTAMAQYAIPAGVTFGLCNIILQMFFSAVFGGKIKIGGSKT